MKDLKLYQIVALEGVNAVIGKTIDERYEIVSLAGVGNETIVYNLRNTETNGEDTVLKIPRISISEVINEFEVYGTNCFISRDFDEAIKYFDYILKLDSENVLALHNKGVALLMLNKLDEALILFNKIVNCNPNDVETLCNKGRIALYQGDYKEAVCCFSEAIKNCDDHIQSIIGLGQAFYYQKEIESAKEQFYKALIINPNDESAIKLLREIENDIIDS